MFNPTRLIIDAFVERLGENYKRTYGVLEPEYPNIVAFVGRMALENIANSDAPYHDLNHTCMVTDVGLEILQGKQLSEGGVSPSDWLHFVIALLCHDIGYVRGVCRGDADGQYVINSMGETISLPAGATDAALQNHHVNRSKIFVQERFQKVREVSVEAVLANIEYTRFPVPEDECHEGTASFPGLLRAADLIGQMADINYIRKGPLLFAEFQETGMNDRLGYKTPADLRAGYPKFFWNTVRPFIGPALRYLQVTQDGKLWIANLYAHVFAEEHQSPPTPSERQAKT